MNPQESLSFFNAQLERSAKGLQIASSSRNVQLAALNLRQMFKGRLVCGLIKWRQRQSPVHELEEAVRIIDEAPSQLTAWDSSFDPERGLPRGRAALLAQLIGVSFDFALQQDSSFPGDVRLDNLLSRTGRISTAKEQARPLIEELRKNKRTVLAADTYENYFDILANENNSEVLANLVANGEALFLKRARDAFFSGGDQSEGGGPENALVVDYRLAVVLKKVQYKADSIHAWVW